MIFISIQKIKNHPKYIYNDDFIIILSLLSSSYALIAHQLMTINGMFIFFVIPMLIGFAHMYLIEHYKKKNYLLYFLIILSFCSTIYYWDKYIHKRDFMDLRAANFNKKTSAEIFDYKLKGLQWISCLSPENPKEEIYNLNKAINIIKNDKRKKSILTDYQFISVILSKYDYSPTQVWFINHVVNQKKDSEYFKSYKKLLINQINKNKIKIVYLIKPLWGGNDIFEKGLENSCYKKIKITEIMDSYIIQDCKDLEN